MMVKNITVLVPTGEARIKEIPIAPRVHDPNDKAIGFLWNRKPNGDILLLRIKEQLSQRFRFARTDWHEGNTDKADDASTMEELASTSDLVINAIGD